VTLQSGGVRYDYIDVESVEVNPPLSDARFAMPALPPGAN
jgi:hypothetical protein